MPIILLIDDDPDVRMLMSRTLQKHGFEVETAARRQEALEKLQTLQPSVILLDVLLSGYDGRELCRELKASALTKDIPVIMFSGHPGASVQYRSYGADDFIAKPFNTELLLQKLEQFGKAVK